ncbi:MAG: tetratricopeptide repeat protein [Kiritimatiellae bacterium]|nr:tetratricopeptide repeat protein [Kiritimatiellia bacterium]
MQKPEQMPMSSPWVVHTARLALLGVALLLFMPSANYDFSHYDDDYQVIENPLIRSLAPRAVARMFATFHITSYYPVRLLSFALDYAVWGLDPVGYHLTNVACHTVNVLLVFSLVLRILRKHSVPAEEEGAQTGLRLDNWRVFAAFCGAGLFAVHPVVVEPVAWIAGREELLMTLFALLGFHFHLLARGVPWPVRRPAAGRGAGEPAPGTRVRWPAHAAAACCCALSCMSNVIGVILPFLALAYDLCLFGRRPARGRVAAAGALLTGTWPLWLIAAGAGIVKKVGDVLANAARPFPSAVNLTAGERILTVFHTYWLHIQGVLWPKVLTIVFPNVIPQSPLDPGVLLGLWLMIGTAFALLALRRLRMLLFGLVWFLVTTVPVTQVMPHHVFRADRFLYLGLAGLAVAAGAGLVRAHRRKWHAVACGAFAAAVLGAFGVQATSQLQHWKNAFTLFTHALVVYPDNEIAHNNLGVALGRQGNVRKAIGHFSRAIELAPDYINAHQNLGNALAGLGRRDEARAHYSKVLRLEPQNTDVARSLGMLLIEDKKYEEAWPVFSAALDRAPQQAVLFNNAGVALAGMGKNEDAIRYYDRALSLSPMYADAYYNLANVLIRVGETERGITAYSRALRVNPDYVNAHHNLGVALAGKGRFEEALTHFSAALELNSHDADVRRSLDELQRYLKQRGWTPPEDDDER